MHSGQLLLVVVSGLGIIHGFFLAAYLWNYSKGNPLAHKILSLLLIVLSLRVGKSFFLEFTTDLDVKLIFTGLSLLMAVGPLFYFLVSAYSDQRFQLKGKYWHFVPAALGMVFGLWIDDEKIEFLPMALFIALFAGYYGHYLLYLGLSYRHMKRFRAALGPTYTLLRLLFFALLLIWITYVLNLFDEFVPYVVGPIIYTLIAYLVSYIVIKKGYLADGRKYKSTTLSGQQIDQLYEQVLQVVLEERQFKNPDITLKSLSEQLHTSTQVLSMVINQKSQMNFNRFINQHRVEEAIRLFRQPEKDAFTIAALAFEAGFSSITSFNAAFKKQTGKTPLAYRKALTK